MSPDEPDFLSRCPDLPPDLRRRILDNARPSLRWKLPLGVLAAAGALCVLNAYCDARHDRYLAQTLNMPAGVPPLRSIARYREEGVRP